LPVATGISGLGTGIATALAVNVGTAGAPVINGGVLGTPSSGTVTNLTGTASININGTVGATTASTGAFTTLSASGDVTLSGGTANGVVYANGSKVLTTGSALTFDGTSLSITSTPTAGAGLTIGNDASGSATVKASFSTGGTERAFISMTGGTGEMRVNAGYSGYGGFTTFYTNGSERMRLDSSGNLGIGTSSPSYRFTVVGATSDATPVANFRGHAGGNDGERTAILRFTSSTDLNWAVARYDAWSHLWHTNGTIKATLDSSGNLGLGVTPSAWASTHKALQMNWSAFSTDAGNGETSVSTNAFASAATTWNYRSTAPASRYTQDFFGKHIWFTAPSGTAGDAISFSQVMTLDASGNLLVGTTSPSFNAGSRGNITVGGSSSAVLALQTGGTAKGYVFHDGTEMTIANEANGFLRFYTNATERARITSGGDLLVGLTSATGVAKLQVSGPIRTTGYTVATLPAGTVGMRTYVTDALAPSFGVAVAGSGAVTIPVFYDGANWIVA
jgi:hypothetical protein